MYAIIDIETTGGSPRTERITEIAIYIHDGEKIVEEFASLVNPERNIPYFITSLTGISNEMVADAPRFFEIAKKIVEITDGNIFVAHNARFDYSFIRQEFKNLGSNRLCRAKFTRCRNCAATFAVRFLQPIPRPGSVRKNMMRHPGP